ncbi:MAG: DUF3067 family protein [Thermostichus sp. DG02_5_bins_236]
MQQPSRLECADNGQNLMTGSDFQSLLQEKWGHSYDVQLRRVNQRVVLLVMWRYLEQPSFPMSEAEYLAHLQGIVAHLQAWGVWEAVQSEIEATRQKPRMGKAVTIPLDLAGMGERASEWLL